MDKTLPSPLTAFEEYMLLDGTAEHPMEFFFRLRFDGDLPREAVRVAAERAAARHPLLDARIDRRRGAPPRFTAASAMTPSGRSGPALVQIAIGSEGPEGYPALPPLDPFRGPLVRLTLVADSSAAQPTGPTDLVAQFHHAACDGLGALDFLDDLLELCDAGLTGRTPRLDRLEPSRLRHRGRFGLDAQGLLASLPSQARGLEGVWKFLANRPLRLEEARRPGAGCGPAYPALASVTVACDAVTTAALRRRATETAASLNDLAACELFGALRECFPFADGDGRVIRLSIPMSLRRAADRRLPAANIVSMVFLDRSADRIDDPVGLLRSIHEEMQLIRRLGLGMTFIFTLWAARLLPGGIAGLVRNRRTAATALFTNIGRIFRRAERSGRGRVRVGDSTLVSIDCLAPLRRGTAVAVTAAESADALRFTLRYDPAVVSRSSMDGLGEAFRGRLVRRARGEGPREAATAECRLPEPVP